MSSSRTLEQEQAILAFARAICSRQRDDAQACLDLLGNSYICAGEIMRYQGQTVLLPDYLHAGTARQRFQDLGIEGFARE